MPAKVVTLVTNRMTPAQALDGAREKLTGSDDSVLVLGWRDNQFFTRSSRLTRAEALWLLETAKWVLVHPEGDDRDD